MEPSPGVNRQPGEGLNSEDSRHPRGPASLDFVVIGAMKAGTTAMCDWMSAQPGLLVSEPKEPGIFVSDEAATHWRHQLPSLFPTWTPGAVCGEGSTDYSKSPVVSGVPRRLQQHSPDVRLIYMMRHPLQRTISQFRFEWLLGGPTMDFDEAVDRNPGLVAFSRYAFQLRQWLEVFPADRLLPVFAEAFAADGPRETRRVLDFLEVEADGIEEPDIARSNESGQLVRPSRARRLLRDNRVGSRIRPWVPNVLIERYRRSLHRKSSPEISNSTRERLIAIFDEDLSDLSDLLDIPGLSCSTWHEVVGRQ